jgi:FKBP-type peptidyl-prolyl cis-trans isomerase SlyD
MSEDVIEKNKVVAMTYRIIDETGNVAEQSDIPVEYIHGVNDTMFEKVEQALEGKHIGDSVEVELSPEEGFGPHHPELTFTDDVENVPPEYRFVGAKPSFQNEHGDVKEFVVSKIENGKLTVDGNHPFAGQTVKFIINVVGVRPATEMELQQGEPLSASAGPDTVQ